METKTAPSIARNCLSRVTLFIASISLLTPLAPSRADDGIQLGQFTINPPTGPVTLTLQGPATDNASADTYGLVLSYHDSATDVSTAVLQLVRPEGQYQWQFSKPNGDPRLALQLGNDHSLTLYNPTDGQSAIVLNPDAITPQILIGNSPVVTVASLTSGSQALYTPDLYLPTTTSGGGGVVYQNLSRFIHSYGTDNIFVGADAGNFTLDPASATSNVGIGANALTSIQSGTDNSAIGANAMANFTSGSENMAIGTNALLNNSASANLAIGANAMGSNGAITGGYNTAIGEAAGYYWKTGTNNLAIGAFAFSSSDGGWGYNIALGNYALSQATGNIGENTGVGAGTLNALDGSLGNTAVGTWSGALVSTGSGNTLVGNRAGYAASGDPGPNSLTTGSNNTFIGALAGFASPTQHQNSTAIGYMATVDADNAVVLGSSGANPAKVGIGTTNPQAALHVNGDVRLDGQVRMTLLQGDILMGEFGN